MIDNWTKEFLAFCDAVNQDLEAFWEEVEQFSDNFPDSWDEMVQNMEDTISQEMELFWQDVFEPLWDFEDFDPSEEGEFDFATTAKVYPDRNTHPACQGCRHYHGYVYGGNLFVCAMHPYGWPDENCPDWEGKDRSDS